MSAKARHPAWDELPEPRSMSREEFERNYLCQPPEEPGAYILTFTASQLQELYALAMRLENSGQVQVAYFPASHTWATRLGR